MAIPWDPGLPQVPLRTGYGQSFGNRLLRSEMDQEPAKVRPKQSRAVRRAQWSFHLTKAQVAVWEAFYDTTLAGGALPFDLAHPVRGGTATFRLVVPPEPEISVSGDGFTLSVQVEEMP